MLESSGSFSPVKYVTVTKGLNGNTKKTNSINSYYVRDTCTKNDWHHEMRSSTSQNGSTVRLLPASTSIHY